MVVDQLERVLTSLVLIVTGLTLAAFVSLLLFFIHRGLSRRRRPTPRLDAADDSTRVSLSSSRLLGRNMGRR